MKKHIVKFVCGAIVAIAIFSALVMLLWNALLPSIFGLAHISFWQALGLLVLARLFFSGFGGGHGRKFAGGFEKNHLREKWRKMTPEERKEFVKTYQHFGQHFGEFGRGFGGFGRGRGFKNCSSDENDKQEKQD
ncbi:MAG: hypothetical protein LBT29_00385 [Flavobacteriaceae bacterium]|nr:hypothetical protein [Flavobacteriaceae bacterium]